MFKIAKCSKLTEKYVKNEPEKRSGTGVNGQPRENNLQGGKLSINLLWTSANFIVLITSLFERLH